MAMNITTLERRIQNLQIARDRLVAKAEVQTKKRLLGLPKQMGLKSIAELIAALQAIGGKKRKKHPNAKTSEKKAAETGYYY